MKEYKCISSTLKRNAIEISQGTVPNKVQKDVKGKEEELFENYVKHNEEKGEGLNAKVCEE